MTVGSMRVVMLVISAASAVLVYVLGRRLSLPRWAAGLGMALFGLSPAVGGAPAGDLPRQHRGDVDAARVLPRRLPEPSPLAPLRRGAGRRRGRAHQGDDAPRPARRAAHHVAAQPPGHPEVRHHRRRHRLRPDRRLVPAVRPAQGRVAARRRPCVAVGRHRLPDEPSRLRLHPHRGHGLVRRPAVLAVLRPRPAPRRTRRRAAAPGHLALVGDRARPRRTRARRRDPRRNGPAPRLSARDVRPPGPALPRPRPRRRHGERRPRRPAQMARRGREADR